MKTLAPVFFGALLATTCWSTSQADVVKVSVTARVADVYDPYNALADQVVYGQVFSGYYRYDTSVPSDDFGDTWAHYLIPGNVVGGAKLALGPLVFESAPVDSLADIQILAHEPGSGADVLYMSYSGMKLTSTGLSSSLTFEFRNEEGSAPLTPALPTTALDLQHYPQRTIQITGTGAGGHFYIVTLEIESAALLPPQIVEVSPGPSRFLPQQHFDAMLLAPVGSTIVAAQASAEGTALALTYPGTCTLAAPNSEGRPGLICPDAHTALATVPTATQVDWSMELADGTVLNQSVEWKLIP